MVMETDDDANCVLYGTPLQEIDEETIINKKAAQDLTVRDEKGRQRFHGAFTGGFSAGYFNTVGTKEGWEPATYVSSRSSKASRKNEQNPEDFMDDEDFSEYGIAPKRIHTTVNFRDEVGVSKKPARGDSDSVIPGEAPLKDIVKPILDSIGIAILKKMGWRYGQGIGPKVKKDSSTRIMGCSLGPLGLDKECSRWDSIMVAPEDASSISYVPKDDLHGLGYSGLSTHSILSIPVTDFTSNSSTKTFLKKDKRKLSIRGQAFGVGALEDDDDDIYSKDDMSQYDFSEFTSQADAKNSSSKTKKTSQNDPGPQVLEGFCRPKAKATSEKNHYPHPSLPVDFQPNPHPNSSQRSTQPMSKLNPAVRSILLGEKPSIKPVSSPIKREGKVSRFEVRSSSSTPLPPTVVTTPVLSTPPGLLMSSKFKPFAEDEEKQKRYQEFLNSGRDKDFLLSLQPKSLTEWEKNQELDEFTKAATFYRPLSKDLDSRFESRSHLGVEISSGLHRTKKDVPEVPPELTQKGTKPHQEELEWHPTSLLCKRFNVPNPYPDSKDTGVLHSHRRKPALFDSMFCDADSYKTDLSTIPTESECNVEESISTGNKKESCPKIDDSWPALSVQTDSVQEKPPMDLFKTIFCSSASEESEASDKEDDSVAKEAPVSNTTASLGQVKPLAPIKSAPKEAFGVFANLDLDAINKRFSAPPQPCPDFAPASTTSIMQDTITEMSKEEKSSSSSYYGPELPPSMPEVLQAKSTWSSHKVLKRKHKHHKRKTKGKKKKKKSSKRPPSNCSSSSTASDQDIEPELIIEKLKKLHRLEKKS